MNYARVSGVYVVPISAYQAVAITGGYGTGREVIEVRDVKPGQL